MQSTTLKRYGYPYLWWLAWVRTQMILENSNAHWLSRPCAILIDSYIHHPGLLLLSSRRADAIKICSSFNQHGKRKVLWVEIFWVAMLWKLSLVQLAAAIVVAVQEKNATKLTRLLSPTTTLIAIGVSKSPTGLCSKTCLIPFLDMGKL